MKRILIAEDEKPIARAMELKLNHSGFEAVVAHDGEEAISMMKEGGFDLLILDLVMPKKDGFEVLNELKSLGNKVPIIVSSNLSQKEDIEKVKDMGAIDYFIKSNIPISEIVEYVKRALL